ncbi:hydrophobic/amphiphilic exporter-1, HAE1 family [Lachnospiraceae bacterium]|nr:hydrophobic/amphiphilic exporter-1, HAE1 family [Lachnospiraceae bacterium]
MISKFSVKRPYTVFVIVIAVIVIGIVALTRMTADLLPNMTLPYVIVITTDMGASPETIEKEITSPIESALATTSNLKNIQSISYNSYSTVILEYEQTSNMDATLIEVQQSLDQVKGTFDDSVGTPIVMQINPNMLPVMVAAVNVENMRDTELSDYIETEIIPQLESIEGVASVTSSGGIKESVKVTLNQSKIDKLNDKIMAEIESQFQDARDELESTKADIESGESELEEGKTTLADTISENKGKLQTTQIELYQSEKELNSQLETLKETKKTLKKTIDSLNETYKGAKKAKEALDGLDSVIELFNQGMLDETTFAATAGMSIEEAMTKQAELSATIDEINKQLAASGASMADQGITLKTYKDIPDAVKTLEKQLTEVKKGIKKIESGIKKVKDGKTATNDALESINKAEIEQSITMAEASAELAQGKAQIENAQKQIDDSVDSAKDAADLNEVLSIDTLNNLLVAQNFDMPAGYAPGKDGDYLVKVGESVADVDELSDTVLIDLNMDSVGIIKVSDVADVKKVDDSADVYAKLNGEPGLLISFEKQTGYATGDVSDAIMAKFESLEKSEEQHPYFAVLMDQGIYIDIIVKSILQNILLGASLAIIILIIFLRDIRPTIIIACAIPISIIFAIVLMYFTGITLNIISMSGLTLGIGMLVDNSIVVIENIFRMRKEGESIKKAAVYGANQVAGAITASTLTTMCVFLPIVFTDGITRQLFVDMGLTIAYTLSASLIVALTLVPAMAQGLLRNAKEAEGKTEGLFMRGYAAFLRGAIKFKPLIFVIMILLAAGSVTLALSRGTEFMPEMQSDQVSITLSPPDEEERSFEEMTEYADKLTEGLLEINEIETIGAMVGNGSTLGALSGGSSESVSMYVLLKEDAKISNAEITKKIMEKADGLDCNVDISTSMMDMDALMGDGISIMIKGRKVETLQKLARDVAASMEGVAGIEELDNGLDNMTKTLKIKVNKKKAADYGLTVAQIFGSISKEIASTRATTSIETDIKDFDVFVETDEQAKITVDDLKKLKLEYVDREENETKEVYLSNIATFEESEELSQVLRSNQNRYVNVTASVDDDHNIGLVGKEVEQRLKDVAIPEGYSITMEGEDETINEAMRQVLLMMALAVVLIYLIMVAQFQSLKSPFIIMFTIPLAFTGGFFALFLAGKAVSVIAMVGFVMLAGIIVNNGIVLVDYINQLRREGMSKAEAIIESAKTRLRPVLMTALTTIISMSTMAVGMGKGTEMSQPMAIVVVGGMIYGTVLTLVLVPCLYDAFNKEKDMTEEEI